ncbi:Pam16-domain-containing protein [Globomyces pollinis-pini]|nr:Pam16-domain-containing protein [Globomyces pollinis-pini]
MNPARVLTQVVLVGGRIVVRAFVDAYAAASAHSAQNAINATKSHADPATRATGMTIEEAKKILNVEGEVSKDNLLQKYEKLFKVNDPKEGGSFYIQSKVFRAKERIDLELEKPSESKK